MRRGPDTINIASLGSLPSRRVLGYPAALALVALAAIVTFLLWQPLLSRNPLALFYAAVVVAAWVGGIGPGILASAAAVALIEYLFIPSFATGITDTLIQLSAFAFISVLVSWLDRRQRVALRQSQHARAAAERANRAKDEFLAVLSHELRTPLTPALAASQAMELNEDVPPGLRPDLAMIKRNIELEARLIDDLLDLTRLSRGKLHLSPNPADVHQLIRHVLDGCRSEMLAKRLELVLDLTAEASHVRGDAARLQQVCWNLIRNAIKFTPEGGRITVRTANVAAGPAGDASPALRVTVTDTGIGIAADILPRVFDAFEQGDQSINRRFGGLGLGLAISRQLVLLHGGTLDADSRGTDQGATFTVTLPRAATRTPASAAAADDRGTGAQNVSRGLRLLLVEDHVDTARVMARLLRATNHEVRTAGTVCDARAAAAQDSFDLLITDVGLPDGTGIELFAELKERYGLRGIAVSGYGMEDDVQRCLAAGFAAHVTKPVDFHRLEDLIQEVAGQCVA